MLLAELKETYPEELRADLQQYYGLNIDEIGQTYSYTHAAILAAQLPQESRCIKKLAPDAAWGVAENMLASIEYRVRAISWMLSEDGRKGRNRPKPIPRPSENEANKSKISNTNMDYVTKILGKPREVKNG